MARPGAGICYSLFSRIWCQACWKLPGKEEREGSYTTPLTRQHLGVWCLETLSSPSRLLLIGGSQPGCHITFTCELFPLLSQLLSSLSPGQPLRCLLLQSAICQLIFPKTCLSCCSISRTPQPTGEARSPPRSSRDDPHPHPRPTPCHETLIPDTLNLLSFRSCTNSFQNHTFVWCFLCLKCPFPSLLIKSIAFLKL